MTRRTTTSRDAAEAAFKAVTTKPAALPPKKPSVPGVKEQVTLRIDRDVRGARSAGALNSFHDSVTLLLASVLRPLALIWDHWRRASKTNAFSALGLAAGRNRGRRLNRFVLCDSNHAGGLLLDDVDDCGFDRGYRHLCDWSPFHCLRRPLFLGRRFLRAHARALDLRFRFFWCRVLCSHLARRLSACLAAFRTFLTHRNALLCFCHGYLL